MREFILAVVLVSSTASASAEVIDVGEHGFTVRNVAQIAAHRSRVYNTAVDLIARWWDPAHTFSGLATNLSLDLKPGGCLCERLTTGGGVTHLTLVYVAPSQEIRFSGALGPLQEMAVTGSKVWKLTDDGSGTRFEWTYAVGGYRPGGLAAIAKTVDGVLAGQLQRLKRFVETGRPE
jgi:hypothetical protein